MGRPAAAVRAAYLLGLAILLVASLLHPVGTPSDRGRLGAAVANVRCVTADSPTLLIETGTLSRDLDNGCPLMLDPTGTSYDTDPGLPRSRRNQPEYQHAMAAYYGGSGAALFMRLSSDAFDPQTMATIRGQLNVARNVGSITVLVRSNP